MKSPNCVASSEPEAGLQSQPPKLPKMAKSPNQSLLLYIFISSVCLALLYFSGHLLCLSSLSVLTADWAKLEDVAKIYLSLFPPLFL